MSKECEFDKDDMIAGYQLDILDSDEKHIVEEHLKECEICRNTLSEINYIAKTLNIISAKELPAGFKESLHNSLIKEQRLLYSDSEYNKKQSFTEILKNLFPLRRILPIAAMIAVVILLSGKMEIFNIADEDNKDNSDAKIIASERINSNTAQEFKPYIEEETQTDNSENSSDTDSSGNTEAMSDNNASNNIMKIQKRGKESNSSNTSVAINQKDNSVNAQDDNKLDIDAEGNSEDNSTVPKLTDEQTANKNFDSENENDNRNENRNGRTSEAADAAGTTENHMKYRRFENDFSMSDDLNAEYGMMSGGSGAASYSAFERDSEYSEYSEVFAGQSNDSEACEDFAAYKGRGAGGSNYYGDNGFASSNDESFSAIGGSEEKSGEVYYINVYSLNRSIIENSEYESIVVLSEAGDYELHLTDNEYKELCSEFNCVPEFIQTKAMDNKESYDVIIRLEK